VSLSRQRRCPGSRAALAWAAALWLMVPVAAGAETTTTDVSILAEAKIQTRSPESLPDSPLDPPPLGPIATPPMIETGTDAPSNAALLLLALGAPVLTVVAVFRRQRTT
jgi:hypothetical protein